MQVSADIVHAYVSTSYHALESDSCICVCYPDYSAVASSGSLSAMEIS